MHESFSRLQVPSLRRAWLCRPRRRTRRAQSRRGGRRGCARHSRALAVRPARGGVASFLPEALGAPASIPSRPGRRFRRITSRSRFGQTHVRAAAYPEPECYSPCTLIYPSSLSPSPICRASRRPGRFAVGGEVMNWYQNSQPTGIVSRSIQPVASTPCLTSRSSNAGNPSQISDYQ